MNQWSNSWGKHEPARLRNRVHAWSPNSKAGGVETTSRMRGLAGEKPAQNRLVGRKPARKAS